LCFTQARSISSENRRQITPLIGASKPERAPMPITDT